MRYITFAIFCFFVLSSQAQIIEIEINGNKYKGEVKKNLPNGEGCMSYTNGDVFTGTWKKGEKHGKGRLELANGDIATGEWRFDKEWKVSYCTADGYEYVDLGLPSGTLWATKNIGASNPGEKGNYFSWAEVSPKEKYEFRLDNYKYLGKDNEYSLLKYNSLNSWGVVDNQYVLLPSDDAAYVLWGEDWHIPTYEQCKELTNRDYCYWEETQYGYRVHSKKYENRSIYFPKAYRYGVDRSGKIFSNESLNGAFYWSCSTDALNAYALGLGFSMESFEPSIVEQKRYNSGCIRPVLSGKRFETDSKRQNELAKSKGYFSHEDMIYAEKIEQLKKEKEAETTNASSTARTSKKQPAANTKEVTVKCVKYQSGTNKILATDIVTLNRDRSSINNFCKKYGFTDSTIQRVFTETSPVRGSYQSNTYWVITRL